MKYITSSNDEYLCINSHYPKRKWTFAMCHINLSMGIFDDGKEIKMKQAYSAKSMLQKDVAAGFMRLNKAIAQTGYCSRRKADELIFSGKVKVNGIVTTNAGTKISPEDKLEVDNFKIGAGHWMILLIGF